jgi:hypothetical protein
MSEQFDRISDYAQRAAALPEAASLRARGAERQRRRLVAQSTGGVGAVVGVAALIAGVLGGSAPRTVEVGGGLPVGSAYVCPAPSGSSIVSFQVKAAPTGAGKTFVLPSGCHVLVSTTGVGGDVATSPPPSPGDWENPVPIPSGTAWSQVTATTKLSPGATLKLEEQSGDYFLDVHEAKAKRDVIYILGDNGPVQVMPLLHQLGFQHLSEDVATEVCQFIDSTPRAVMDIRDAEGHSVLGRQVSLNEQLTFFDAPDATGFPSGAEDGEATAASACATP